MQLTIDIKEQGKKITVKSRAMTYQRNFSGWRVNVNGIQYEIRELISERQAIEAAYVRYVKEYC